MKKKILCSILAAVMLLMAVPAFAERFSSSYTTETNPVRHKFTTAGYLEKGSSKKWTKVTDSNIWIRFYNPDNNVTVEHGSHYFYVYSDSGVKLTNKITNYSGMICSTTSFIKDTKPHNKIRLMIYNPNYSSGTVTWMLNTKGNFSGSAS